MRSRGVIGCQERAERASALAGGAVGFRVAHSRSAVWMRRSASLFVRGQDVLPGSAARRSIGDRPRPQAEEVS
jgi:hypothetical protein